MNDTICYLNTDLDLVSGEDLTKLGKAFKTGGLCPLHVTRGDDGLWYARFETNHCHDQPEVSIAIMVDVVESLNRPLLKVWKSCTLREFNMGYDCAAKPWAFNQGLSTELLGRMAAVGASLRLTLYPDSEPGKGCPVLPNA